MVDHEVDGHQRIDPAGVGAAAGDGIAQGRQVDDRGHAGQVLHQHARGQEGQLGAGGGRRPRGQRAHILLAHVGAPGPPQQVLQEHAHRVRKRQRIDQAVEAVEGFATRKRVAGAEEVGLCHPHNLVDVRDFAA